MSSRRTDNRPRVAHENADDRTTSIVPAGERRIIPVGNAKTIVVQPRIPAPYKAMIWFSFALNALLLFALLLGGAYLLNLRRQAQAQLDAVQAALNLDTPIGQRVATLTDEPTSLITSDPQPAIDTARTNVDQVMTAIEGLQNAHIRTTIPINQQLPINLAVPVSQQTSVQTTAPVPVVAPATFTFPGGGGQINGSVALSLPPGLELPIGLNLTIPISATVPVQFDVPVDIATKDTELADDFNSLHSLVEPAAKLLKVR